jgi:hypothetical protein
LPGAGQPGGPDFVTPGGGGGRLPAGGAARPAGQMFTARS